MTNEPPIANEDAATTPEDVVVVIDVLGNDADPEGDAIWITGFDRPAHGSVQWTPVAGLLQYTPSLNYSGPDVFAYTITDGAGNVAVAKVRLTVTAVNDAPVASNRQAATSEDTPVVMLLQALDPDPEECALAFSIVSGPTYGTLGPITDAGCSPNGDMANVTYTPAADWSGTDMFTYKANDGTVDGSVATGMMFVRAVNDAPVAAPVSRSTAAESPASLTLSASDVDNCELSFAIVNPPSHGSLGAISPVPCTAGSPSTDRATVVYTPATGYAGSDSFTYEAGDGLADSAPASVLIDVIPPAQVHVADLDAFTSGRGNAWNLTVRVLIHDWSHASISGAMVSFSWSGTYSGTNRCVTEASGACTISGPAKGKRVTFTVAGVSYGDHSYSAASNHDPDGDSDGTRIVVKKP